MGFFLDVYLANIISIVPVMEQKAGTGLHGFKDTCLLEYIVRGRSFLKEKTLRQKNDRDKSINHSRGYLSQDRSYFSK